MKAHLCCFPLMLLLLSLPALLWGATCVSVSTGDWSSPATWDCGGKVPGDGDTATISSSHTVTVDTDVTVGSNSTAVGPAIKINGTSSSVYGKLIVVDGAGSITSF